MTCAICGSELLSEYRQFRSDDEAPTLVTSCPVHGISHKLASTYVKALSRYTSDEWGEYNMKRHVHDNDLIVSRMRQIGTHEPYVTMRCVRHTLRVSVPQSMIGQLNAHQHVHGKTHCCIKYHGDVVNSIYVTNHVMSHMIGTNDVISVQSKVTNNVLGITTSHHVFTNCVPLMLSSDEIHCTYHVACGYHDDSQLHYSVAYNNKHAHDKSVPIKIDIYDTHINDNDTHYVADNRVRDVLHHIVHDKYNIMYDDRRHSVTSNINRLVRQRESTSLRVKNSNMIMNMSLKFISASGTFGSITVHDTYVCVTSALDRHTVFIEIGNVNQFISGISQMYNMNNVLSSTVPLNLIISCYVDNDTISLSEMKNINNNDVYMPHGDPDANEFVCGSYKFRSAAISDEFTHRWREAHTGAHGKFRLIRSRRNSVDLEHVIDNIHRLMLHSVLVNAVNDVVPPGDSLIFIIFSAPYMYYKALCNSSRCIFVHESDWDEDHGELSYGATDYVMDMVTSNKTDDICRVAISHPIMVPSYDLVSPLIGTRIKGTLAVLDICTFSWITCDIRYEPDVMYMGIVNDDERTMITRHRWLERMYEVSLDKINIFGEHNVQLVHNHRNIIVSSPLFAKHIRSLT